MKSFEENRVSLVNYLKSEIAELKGNDPRLFGKAGRLDSVSSQIGLLNVAVRIAAEAESSADLLIIEEWAIHGFDLDEEDQERLQALFIKTIDGWAIHGFDLGEEDKERLQALSIKSEESRA